MSEYPLIKKLGLDYEETCYPDFGIKLERLLQNATVVYGSIVKHKDEYEWAQDFKEGDTHKALLLAIEPIEQKKVTITRKQLLDALDAEGYDHTDAKMPNKLANRLGL